MQQPETSKPETKNATFRSSAITHFGEPWTALPDKLDYLAFAQETCPTTGKIHYQAWAYACKPMRLTGWKKIFPGDHIEQMRGTFDQNDAYCSKQGQLVTFGTRPMGNGKRRDLESLTHDVCEAALTGLPLDEIVTKDENRATFVQYHNGISKLYNMQVTNKARKIDRDFAPQVIYISGPPGSGKTRFVHDKEPNLFNIPPSDKYKWHDGYSGQDAVLYDNVSQSNVDPTQLLREIDRYFIQVSVKGGFIGWRPMRVYITSVLCLDTFASTAGFSDPREFIRRITEIKNL